MKLIDDLAGLWVVESIQKRSEDSEGLWDNATDLTTMESLLSGLNSDIKDADTSEGTGHPKLIVVEGTRVHAEACIWNSNGCLGDLEQSHQIWAA